MKEYLGHKFISHLYPNDSLNDFGGHICSICNKEVLLMSTGRLYYWHHFKNKYASPMLVKLTLSCNEEQIKKLLE